MSEMRLMHELVKKRLIEDNDFPDLPTGWSVERLRFLFTESKERNGKMPVGEMLSVSEYRGVVPREYDSEEQKRTDEELENYRVVRPGQLAVNSMWLNHLGLGVSDHLGHVSPAYSVYDISKRLDRRFVHHLMRSNYYLKVYLRYLYGIRPNSFQIKASDWASIPIIVPDLPTQRAIADFLDRETARIDTLIEKKQRLVELLGEKKLAELTSIVTGKSDGRPKVDSGYDWIGAIPDKWRAERLKFVTKKIVDGTHFTPTYVDEGVPFLRVTDISKSNRGIDWSSVSQIPFEEHQALSKRVLARKGDLLLSKNGTVGIPRVVDWNFEFSFFVSLCLIRPTNEVKPELLEMFFRSPIVIDQINNGSRKTSVINLVMEKIRELVVVVPPREEQDAIVDSCQRLFLQFDAILDRVQSSIDRLKEYRSALITSAVTGQIDVTKWTNAGTTDRQLDAIEEEFGA